MSNLVSIDTSKDLSSKYDFHFRGKRVRFTLDGCSCENAITAKFIIELKAKDVAPPFLRPMISEDQTHEETVLEEHIELKWWERMLLRRTLKTKVEKWAAFHRRKFLNIELSEKRAKEIQGLIG